MATAAEEVKSVHNPLALKMVEEGVKTYYDGTPRYEGGWKTFARSGAPLFPVEAVRGPFSQAACTTGPGKMEFVSTTAYEGNWEAGCIQAPNLVWPPVRPELT
jgi:hypothetical protein